MTTTIIPAVGAGAIFTQQGVGSAPGYSALDVRRADYGPMQEGVYGTSTTITAGGVANVPNADFMITQRNAGANMSVDVNMPAGGFAFVQGDTLAGQALYTVPVHSSNINELIATADASNPRIDQIILELQDNALDASGGNQARTRVLTGTPTASTTLTTRAGATVLPGSALLLADVLVPAAATSVPNANIRDRRKWARGAYIRIIRQANAAAGQDYSTTNTTATQIDATNLNPRIECSGVPLRLELKGSGYHSVSGAAMYLTPTVDGVAIDGGAYQAIRSPSSTPPDNLVNAAWDYIPGAGSHLLSWSFAGSTAGTSVLFARNVNPLIMTFREDVRSSVANNAVTSG